MLKKTGLLLGAAAGVALAGAMAIGAFAQGAAGPFTQAQADAGRQAYNDNCAICHQNDLSGATDAPPLAGDAFFGAWKGRSTEALYSKIHATMPAGRGGPDGAPPAPATPPNMDPCASDKTNKGALNDAASAAQKQKVQAAIDLANTALTITENDKVTEAATALADAIGEAKETQ